MTASSGCWSIARLALPRSLTSTIKPAPAEALSAHADYVTGIVQTGTELIILLDVDKVLLLNPTAPVPSRCDCGDARMTAEDDWKLLLDLVSREFGLVFQDARRGHLESRMAPRLQALGLDSFGAYHRYLARHPQRGAELRMLARILPNNETYFFREAPSL